MKKTSLVPLLAALLFLWGLLPMKAVAGPTPYPDPKNEAAWPGQGPIRCFPWMTDNRNAFWTQREKQQGAVVFAGDSNTFGWKERLKEYFPELNSANRGIGGDTSRGLRFRFQEDVLDLNPAGIVILIGGNDLSAHGKPEDAVANMAAMLDAARAKNPDLPIVLCQNLPKNDPKAPLKPGAKEEINRRIAELGAKYQKLVVLDLYTSFLNSSGEQEKAYFGADMTHLSAEGYKRFAEVLRPALVQLGLIK